MAKNHTQIEHSKSMEINRKRKHKVRWNENKLNETLKCSDAGMNESLQWYDVSINDTQGV